MSAAEAPDLAPWLRAAMAAAVFACDPPGTGGVILRARAGPVRERWLALLTGLLAPDCPLRRIPPRIADDRLLGGLDLAATLRSGRPVVERGVLADVDGGVLLVPMAERIERGLAARLAATMDTGRLVVQREGVQIDTSVRFGIVALDEGDDADERAPAALADRAALWVDLDGLRHDATDAAANLWTRDDVVAAARRVARMHNDDTRALEVLCTAAAALGIASLRAPLLALRVARIAAALDGREQVADDDVTLAAQLVLAPRATRMPATEPRPDEPADDEPPPDDTPSDDDTAADDTPPESAEAPDDTSTETPPEPPIEDADDTPPPDLDDPALQRELEERVLEAAAAALPPALLAALGAGRPPTGAGGGGRAGGTQQGGRRGRPAGTRRGTPDRNARLNVVETLRAAAPWQPLRRRQRAAAGECAGERRVEVRVEDFRVTRYRQPAETVTIFVVDASGSSALNRLAEAKGAIELLLADCYVRRDQVALVAFRGTDAELLLPPTRSLVRAKRSLAGLPGGGGTPLAAGIDAAAKLADDVRRRGATPLVVMLTDGQANIARDGRPGRRQAGEDALDAARRVAVAGHAALLIDTSPRRRGEARAVADAMRARFLQLPRADAGTLSRAVQAAAPA